MNKKFRFHFLGTGTMFGTENFHSNCFLIAPDKKIGDELGDDKEPEIVSPKLLIDCGSDIKWSLPWSGYTPYDVTDVYISHLHGDHAFGLEHLGFATFFSPAVATPPRLYISKFLRDQLWSMLKYSMKSLANQTCNLNSFYDVRSIPQNNSFMWEGCEIIPVQQIHITDEYTSRPSFGLKIILPDERVVYHTTDTKYFPDQMRPFYEEACMIIQDCEVLYAVEGVAPGSLEFREGKVFLDDNEVEMKPLGDGKVLLDGNEMKLVPFRSSVHAHYDDLSALGPDVKTKMYLQHIQDNWKYFIDPEKDGFAGVLAPGQIVEI